MWNVKRCIKCGELFTLREEEGKISTCPRCGEVYIFVEKCPHCGSDFRHGIALSIGKRACFQCGKDITVKLKK